MKDILVFVSVFAGRWPALQSYWCLDDWGQLARSAGILAREPGLPARWLSQDLWWTMTWPVLGLDATAHALLRLGIHGLSAVLIARIARQATGNNSIGMISGCLFAATPIAFTPLMWASGIQELLAGLFALAAVERCWFGGKSRWWQAAALGSASILSKESGFGLPILFALHLIWVRWKHHLAPKRDCWLAIGLLFLAISYESVALWQRFATGEADPYNTGGLSVILGNIGVFGLWLGTPGPFYTANFTWAKAGWGSLLFVVWLLWGIWQWRRGQRLALTAFFGGMLSLAPSLILVKQTHPYLAYLAAGALCLTIAEAVPKRLYRAKVSLAGFMLAMVALGLWNMQTRAGALRDEWPADPVVRAMVHTRTSAPIIGAQRQDPSPDETTRLIIYQPPVSDDALATSARAGAFKVLESNRYVALGGNLGPQLILGPNSEVTWRNSLLGAPQDARVLCETREGLAAWGNTWNALIYASLIDIMIGHFERAEAQLSVAAQWDQRVELFFFDLKYVRVSRAFLTQRLNAFLVWQAENSRHPDEENELHSFVKRLAAVTTI